MPTATELNASDIADLKASNREIVSAIADIKVEIAHEFGAVRADFREFQASTRLQMRLIGLVTAALFPIVVTLIGAAIAGGWYMGQMAIRLDRVEHKVEGPN